MEVLYKVISKDKVVGYILKEKYNIFYIKRNEVKKYKPINAICVNNDYYRAKLGESINSIKEENINLIIETRRTSQLGKPRLLSLTQYGELSLKQKKLLELLKNNVYVRIDKKTFNINITMKDLSCLTAYTGLEYSLFERNDKYILVKGGATGMNLGVKLSSEIINGKYRWEGHTHPGYTRNSLMPSSSDYNVLKLLHQKRSAIYNSCGDYLIYELEV